MLVVMYGQTHDIHSVRTTTTTQHHHTPSAVGDGRVPITAATSSSSSKRRFPAGAVLGQGYWLVLRSSRCDPFGRRQAQDARHHGQYEPEGQLRGEIVAALVADYGRGVSLAGFSVLVLFCSCRSASCCLLPFFLLAFILHGI